MTSHIRRNIPLALSVISKEIEIRMSTRESEPNESNLWQEFSCCLLSSQVPYSLAVAASSAIEESGVLLDANISCQERTVELKNILNTPQLVDGKYRKYRFPNKRAEQLSESCLKIRSESRCFKSHIESFNNPRSLRKWFVDSAPGVGPKQASMFIRNISHSYELAIMDRHVIDYMRVMGMYEKKSSSISGLAEYHRQEEVITAHACEKGYAVGVLDWAIWIVMRQLKSIETSEALV